MATFMQPRLVGSLVAISIIAGLPQATEAATLVGRSPSALLSIQSNLVGGWQYGYYQNGVFIPLPASGWNGSAWVGAGGVITANGGSINAAQAASGQKITRRWTSPFSGSTILSMRFADILGGAMTGKVKVTPYLDGIAQPTFTADPTTGTDPFKFNLDVKKGSRLDFVFESTDGWVGQFDFGVEISASPGVTFVEFSAPATFDVGCTLDLIGRCGNQLPLNLIDMEAAYQSIGGPTGILGNPTSAILPTQGLNGYTGWRQNYQGGAVFQSRYGSYPVFGGIGNHYLSQAGGETGVFGFPTSGEIGIGTGTIQQYQGGRLEWVDSIPIVVPDPQPTPLGYPQPVRHVGFLTETEKIIEAYSTETRLSFDPYKNQTSWRPGENGVQDDNTLGSFTTRSPSRQGSPVIGHKHITVDKEYLDPALAKVQGTLGSAFLDTSFQSYSCYDQLGGSGAYSSAGLIESAFQGISALNGSEGWIDQVLECYTPSVNDYQTGQGPISPNNNTDDVNSFLSVGFLQYAIEEDIWKYKTDWLRGLFEADELVVTDPLGRQIIYRDGGLTFSNDFPASENIFFQVDHVFDSIFPERVQPVGTVPANVADSNTVLTLTTPPPSAGGIAEPSAVSPLSFSGVESAGARTQRYESALQHSARVDTCPTKDDVIDDGESEDPKLRQHIRVFIPNRLPGQYIFDMFSKDGHSQAVVGTNEQTTTVAAKRCADPTTIPEPSGVVGLMALPLAGWLVKRLKAPKA
jgi:hypothetical protein